MPVLIDTSVLLRLRDPNDPNHTACRAVLDPANVTAHGICLCAQVLIEYWVVATRPPGNNGFGLSPRDEIDRRLAEWRDKEIANRIRILKITLRASVIVAAFSLIYAYLKVYFFSGR